MNQDQHARRLLDRLGLRHPCDLDLLVFFARHPRTLLATEHLANFVGYELKQIAASLDVLLEAGFLRRTPDASHAARMFVFAAGGPNDEWLPPLLHFASTREGRLAMRRALKRPTSGTGVGPTAAIWPEGTLKPGVRLSLARRKRQRTQESSADEQREGGRDGGRRRHG